MSRPTTIFSALACVLATSLAAAACSASAPVEVPPAEDGGGLPVTQLEAGTPETSTVDGSVPTATCGNGKIEAGESCDDGNAAGGDGCSPACKIETAFEGDACPGKALALTGAGALLKGTVTGTTKGAFNHYGSSCGGGSAPDVVYTFTPASSGKAVVKLTADFGAILSARASCDTPTSESKCSDVADSKGGTTSIEFPVFAGAPVSLFVDGYAGATGTFTLDVEVSNAVCGNGVAELPETCDDGNKTAGDGCSPTCALEGGGVIDACPGQPFLLSGPAGAPRKISFAGNTKLQGSKTQGIAGCYFQSGNNTVYAVKSDVAGAVKAELTTGYAKASLHVRTDCASTTYQTGCTSLVEPAKGKLDFPVTANQWFYVIVDSDGDGGPYTLDVSVTPGACGNHLLDGNEQCDDGNAASGDGCSPTCTLEPIAGADTCPGHALTLAAQADGSRTGVVSGTTTGLANDVASCQSLLSANAPDAVFAVTADIDGALELELDASFQATLSVIDRCSAPLGERSTVLACSYNAWIPPLGDESPYVVEGMGSGRKTVRAPVAAGKTYWVVVDGSVGSSNAPSAAAGPFELRAKLAPAACGNGIIDGGETCDDGATEGGDGCSATCQLEPATVADTCANAADVPFVDEGAGKWTAAVKSGTTNLSPDQNFGSSSAQAGTCWARGRDAYFKVTSPAAGVLTASVKTNAFDAILGLRSPGTCAASTVPTQCSNEGPRGVEERVKTVVAAGEVVYLVVDTPLLDVNGCTPPVSATFAADCAKLEQIGRFALDVSIAPSGCGDGFFVKTATEECDDGNNVSGDGCSATCKLEAKLGIDVCPGTTLALTGAGTLYKGTITVATSSLAANYVGACGGNAKDGVVRVVAPASGTMTGKIRNMPGGTVYARKTCNDPSTELLKTSTSSCTNVVHDTVTFPVTAGAEYFLFVDGIDGATGVPTLDVTVTP